MSTETKTDKAAGKAADDTEPATETAAEEAGPAVAGSTEDSDGAEATTGEGAEAVAADDDAVASEDGEDAAAAADAADADDAEDGDGEAAAAAGTGVGQGAAAVVSAALGFVSLSGSWLGTVASDRSALVGQMESSVSQNADVAAKMQAVYGDSWQMTALFGGAFALVALVVGVLVLARPAFGAPGRIQPAWIKSVAWAGVALGVVGLLLAIAKYTDLIFSLPSVPS